MRGALGPFLALLALTGVSAPGCASSPAVRMADRGERAALHDALAARQRAGDLSNEEAASIARHVVAEGLRTVAPSEAPARVRDVRGCAREVDSALAERMAVHDEGGAQAALARLDARSLGPGDVRKFAGDADAWWRAVGVRSLVGDTDGPARARALVDPSPAVRRAAARAARETADPADAPSLAEAARVDPDPLVRTEAVRALAALPAPGGRSGFDTTTVLRDLWTGADDPLREDIAIAWTLPGSWAAGGREALRVVVASGYGPGVLEGAAAVLRRPEADPEIEGIAVGVLTRAIASGSRRARLQALAEVPLNAQHARHQQALLAAVRDAAKDGDLEVKVSALARLAEAKVDGVLAELEALAQPNSPVAERARFALAAAGDRRIQVWLESDLASDRPDARLLAAGALAKLGVAARAAPLLADSDASVRLRAACTIVGGARFRR